MHLLDTDHMSLLDRGGAEGARIRARLRGIPPDDVATSIVSYEEQMRGWLSRIAQAPTMQRQMVAYGELKRQLEQTQQELAAVGSEAEWLRAKKK